MKFRYGQKKDGRWVWWIVVPDKNIAVSARTYSRKQDCMRALQRLRDTAPDVELEQSDAGFLD